MDHPANTNMLWLGLAKAIAKGDSDQWERERAVVLADALGLSDKFITTYIADTYRPITYGDAEIREYAEHIPAMREWLADIAETEQAEAEVATFCEWTVLDFIARLYEGGIEQFIAEEQAQPA